MNINSGDGTSSDIGFTYTVAAFKPVIGTVNPSQGDASGGTLGVTITGANFQNVTRVTIGGRSAPFTVIDDNTIQVSAVPPNFGAPPDCEGTNPAGTLQRSEEADVTVTTSIGCTATLPKGFTYLLPCVIPPPPGVRTGP